MRRLDGLVELIRQHVTTGYCKSFFELLLAKGKATLQTYVGLPDELATIHEDLIDGYIPRVYEELDNDKARNAYFNKAIEAASRKYSRWFEIGPGALGTLSHMVLDAGSRNTLHSVEAVPLSVTSLQKRFRHEPRFHVVQGLAGITAISRTPPFQVVLAEILGHFASNEGYVAILHQCAENYPSFRDVKMAIPLMFGTKIVPVDLSRAAHLSIAKIASKLVMINSFPIDETQLSTDHGTMEMYNALTEMAERSKKPRVFTNTWKMAEARPFHGFGCYLVFGDDDQGWMSSLECQNWHQVFIPVGEGMLLSEPGDIIKVTTTCHVHLTEPLYKFAVTLDRSGRRVHSERIVIRYKDVMSPAHTLRSLKRKKS